MVAETRYNKGMLHRSLRSLDGFFAARRSKTAANAKRYVSRYPLMRAIE